MSAPDLNQWIPIRLYRDGFRPMVDWCYVGDTRFSDPFFEMTMQRVMQRPFSALFRRQTPIEFLEERAISHPGIPPTGFIFHMSRCGSTLISQMLAAAPANISISEAWAIDTAINADARHPEVTFDDRVRWVRAVIHALGQQRLGTEQRYFVKFDAWQTLDLALVRRAFPDVHWIFVYRDPIEVMMSQLKRPAPWTVPGMVPIRDLPFSPAEFAANQVEFTARVLGLVCQAGLSALDGGRGMLLNYSELPAAMYSTVAAHFGCTWTSEELELMRQAERADAKAPQFLFEPDSQEKQRAASANMRGLCDQWLAEIYQRLEAARGAGQG